MRTMRYKPSKPVAVLSIVMGVGLLVFGIANFWDAGGGGRAFLVFWCLMVVAVTGLQVWAAFSKNGSMGVLMPGAFVSGDDEESRPAR
ncbi:hypothetical protein [Blastococcus sp. LR1]|uniref:hypothetical protein n=1 Tax=Blastococcus sp. LR1 TaxID=2877000 RepID=UPI001CCE84D3|nr:hypothetical protein [Blastococcus sp. LR1]MCA0145492.1 hypothetical protein [Blastococcus sp. LR1]